MPSIVEGEWDLYNWLAILFLIIVFIGMGAFIVPKILDGAEMIVCGMPCGCGDNPRLQHSVEHFIVENQTLYAQLCDGTVMEVKGFESQVFTDLQTYAE